jgi:phenylpyruvate tautomerase PptA (4-oxalocrotonate tautomerase family)
MFTLQQALTALAQHASNNCITEQQVAQLLASNSATFASIVYVTQVATAAAHKQHTIQKVTKANVTLFNTAHDYTAAVQRSAQRIAQNNTTDVAQFTAQSNYYEHTNCYSIVQHKQHNTLYLFASYNNASSLYFIDGVQANKQQVASYLTASAATKLLQDNSVVHNVSNNVLHTVHIRTVQLSNIVSITANKQQLTV